MISKAFVRRQKEQSGMRLCGEITLLPLSGSVGSVPINSHHLTKNKTSKLFVSDVLTVNLN